mmetsp:Transcript_60149/g.136005  ORF Transcript_60149/g.136005 Transcript_60149/m.136005 type:complete len:293 (+) Transcript_60149:186-1064(+)
MPGEVWAESERPDEHGDPPVQKLRRLEPGLKPTQPRQLNGRWGGGVGARTGFGAREGRRISEDEELAHHRTRAHREQRTRRGAVHAAGEPAPVPTCQRTRVRRRSRHRHGARPAAGRALRTRQQRTRRGDVHPPGGRPRSSKAFGPRPRGGARGDLAPGFLGLGGEARLAGLHGEPVGEAEGGGPRVPHLGVGVPLVAAPRVTATPRRGGRGGAHRGRQSWNPRGRRRLQLRLLRDLHGTSPKLVARLEEGLVVAPLELVSVDDGGAALGYLGLYRHALQLRVLPQGRESRI